MHNTKRKCVLVVSAHMTKQRVRYNAHQRIANMADRRINCQLNDGSALVSMHACADKNPERYCWDVLNGGLDAGPHADLRLTGQSINFLTGGTDL